MKTHQTFDFSLLSQDFEQSAKSSICSELDFGFLFQATGSVDSNSYLLISSLENKTFVVSENFKSTFGFPSTCDYHFFEKWEEMICHHRDLEAHKQQLAELLQSPNKTYHLRYRVQQQNGSVVWMHCKLLAQWNDEQTKPLFIYGYFHHQNSQFTIDPLTNFPRVLEATQKLESLIQDCPHLVIAFSFNNFTVINESFGRSFGDTIIKNIACKLSAFFGSQIDFYRLDGISFMGIARKNAFFSEEEIIQKIKETISNEYAENSIFVRKPCVVAVLEFPSNNLSAEECIVNALTLIDKCRHNKSTDYLMYPEKNFGQEKRNAQIALALNNNVLKGFKNFRIMIQPIVGANNDGIYGGEVLLRWKYENKDISPAVFVPILEENGMISVVGKWVFEQAVKVCKSITESKPEFYLSFNISYLQIADQTFLPFMKSVLERYQLDGKHIVAELTETHFDETPEILENFIVCCKEMGIRIALDDFGSGYSSLGILLKYPTDIVKLDRSLLHAVKQSNDKMRFIKSNVFACHQFFNKVCMEGVETQEEVELVRSTGCDMIQGYYFFKPMEVSEAFHTLTQNNLVSSH